MQSFKYEVTYLKTQPNSEIETELKLKTGPLQMYKCLLIHKIGAVVFT